MPVLVAVGCSSSLGSLALQRFLATAAAATECWTVYASHRSPDPPHFLDTHGHHVEWIPLELESLASVKRFAERVTPSRVDLVWLNAAIWDETPRVIQLGHAAWTREAVVNSIAQHYLVHLLADKLASPPPNSSSEEEGRVVERARIVWTTSNLHKSIPTLAQIPLFLRAATPSPPLSDIQSNSEEEENTTPRTSDSTATPTPTTPTPKQRYAASKAAQLLSAFYWRRHFSLLEREQECGAGVREEEEATAVEGEGERCSGKGSKRWWRRPVDVVAVSPGFVPATNLSRDSNWFVRWLMRHVVGWFPFAVSVEEGAARIARSLQMMSTTPRSDAMKHDDGGTAVAAAADEQQRQQQSALHPTEEEEEEGGDSTPPPSQPDSTKAASTSSSTWDSNADSDSRALAALLQALPPSQILYLSLPSTTPLPGPSRHVSLLSRTVSHARRDTQNKNQDEEEGREAEAGEEFLVRGGAVGEWAAARGGCDKWDEVEELGILPSREEGDRFAAAEVAEEDE